MCSKHTLVVIIGFLIMLFASACGSPNPQLPAFTAVPTLAPGATLTLVPAIHTAAQVSESGEAITVNTSDAALGAPFFLKNCSPCHGNRGEGVDAPPLRNNQFIQTGEDQAVFETIANGRTDTEMPAWLQVNGGPLTEGQIQDVIAYLHTLQNLPSLPTATPHPEAETEPEATPGGPTPEPARPSNSGGTGEAVTLQGDPDRGREAFGLYCSKCHGPEGVQGVPNPGSDDGSVPVLNPIDPTIASSDPQTFAANVDLFIEHGSLPEGEAPLLLMPDFGDSQMLTSQQIADLLAYILELNSGE